MNIFRVSIFLLLLLVSHSENKIYIVYFGEQSSEGHTSQTTEETHFSYLFSVKENEKDAKSSLIYSYKNINAFAAHLSPQQASILSGLQETNSLNNADNLWLKSGYGKNVIIGVLDTGVWPESQSFKDEGMGPIATSWKGICQSGDAFNSSHCNKKIIGARYYTGGLKTNNVTLNPKLDYLSPRDKDGHGTHTSSIAGGRRVHNVSALGGLGQGSATGGAPLARLAIYKVCWAIEEGNSVCYGEDVFAAIDDAISDGVDLLSISLGGPDATPYEEDAIAIGALHAVKHNIIVACIAGNWGPNPATVTSAAPWVITVGASSVDRVFSSPVVLGSGTKIPGQSLSPYKLENKFYPLVSADEVIRPNVSKNVSGQCLPDSLSPDKAKGTIVLCFRGYGTRVGKGAEVKRAGGIGFILGNNEANRNALAIEAHLLPAAVVSFENAIEIKNYIKSTKEPKAYIVPAKTVLDVKPAPVMAAFSGRGPNIISPDILKPDITAPGLNILAAWSEVAPPSNLPMIDDRVVKYNIQSGTSMSCPHVSGALALIKAVHPDWSSAAIRSAIMTSAEQGDNEGNPITDAFGDPADPFQYGSGHFRPTKAADPGLVYDASYRDYLLFLCSSGVKLKKIDPSFKCPKKSPSPANLNYPSLAIPRLKGTVTVIRTVTNVGSNYSVYSITVKSPPGISVQISPPILKFTRAGQKLNFTITVKIQSNLVEKGKYLFGSYEWCDGIHKVWSPIAVSVA